VHSTSTVAYAQMPNQVSGISCCPFFRTAFWEAIHLVLSCTHMPQPVYVAQTPYPQPLYGAPQGYAPEPYAPPPAYPPGKQYV
jgi:hypothetical protein